MLNNTFKYIWLNKFFFYLSNISRNIINFMPLDFVGSVYVPLIYG